MGLYINHLEDVNIRGERSLYVYLLDYGWPDGEWETLFKRNFMRMAQRASETDAVVIGSPGGIHFSNDVLSWHRVGKLDPDKVLPGLLITKTHPEYFRGNNYDYEESLVKPSLGDLLVIPLLPFCTSETEFIRAVEGVFADLKRGVELNNFRIARHDVRRNHFGKRVVDAIELKPSVGGVSVNLKTLLGVR